MKINKKLLARTTAFVLAGTMTATILTGCGNKQLVDFNKSFNVAIETNQDNVSVVGIKNYSDYVGTQVQFETEDNLRVLTSTHQTELLKVADESSAYSYADALAGNNGKINDYNKMQEIQIDTSKDFFNKDIIDFHYTYNKVIILSGKNAVITEIKSWKDYRDDDKVQITLKNGVCILRDVDKVKFVNDMDANKDSLKNYAISLVGDEENVIYYDINDTKEPIK